MTTGPWISGYKKSRIDVSRLYYRVKREQISKLVKECVVDMVCGRRRKGNIYHVGLKKMTGWWDTLDRNRIDREE